MPGLDIGNAPSNAVVLPFYTTGAAAFLTMTVLLFLSSFALTGGYFEPHILAIVHTTTLGWATMIIFGASYQLLPVISERDLFSERLGEVSYYFLLAGAVCLIIAFWTFTTGFWMILGGALVVVATLLYGWNVLKTLGSFLGYNVQRLFLLSAAVWLVITTMIGLLLAINLRYPFIDRNHLEILKLHAHAGLIGWFLQLIIGVSVKLVPMFLLSHIKRDGCLKWAFGLINGGLILFLLDGFFFEMTWRCLIYAAMVLAGIVCWLWFVRDAYKHKLKKVDVSMRHTFLAFSSLLIAAIVLPIMFFSGNTKWATIYGFFLLVGWISSIILGMTFKTLPFIVWNNKYKLLNGKVKIPLPRDLVWSKILNMQFWFFVSALYVIGLSLVFEAYLPLRLGLGLLVITALLYVANTIKVVTHRIPKNIRNYGI